MSALNMSALKVLYLTLLNLCLLAACQYNVRDVTSPYYQPPVNSRLLIHQPITIPAGRASVFIQEGETTGSNFNHYVPHCRLEVRRVGAASQIVQPGEFNITRVYRDLPPVVALKPVHYAELGSGGSGLFLDLIYVIYMRLSSAQQPDVLNITCGGSTDDAAVIVPPSIEEIRGALGDLASLRLPAE